MTDIQTSEPSPVDSIELLNDTTLSDTLASEPLSSAPTEVDSDATSVQASQELESSHDFKIPGAEPKNPSIKSEKTGISAAQVFINLVAFRTINALSIQTFFQPDEYFQSLEPAWQIAFGNDSGAWITWVIALRRC